MLKKKNCSFFFDFILGMELLDSVTISTDGWYPCKPPQTLPDSSITSTITFDTNLACPDHPSWESTKTTKINVNVWPKQVKKVHGERCRRHSIHGVEIRDLPRGHLLHGEQGLFATKKFQQFDIVGEYNGKVVLPSIGGHYVACLEDGVTHEESLGLDAADMGSEMRYINSYLNIEFSPNVAMKTVYIDTYPRIIIIVVAMTIEPGDELLLDYGDNYTQAFFTPSDEKEKSETKNITDETKLLTRALKKLPFMRDGSVSNSDLSSSDEEEE